MISKFNLGLILKFNLGLISKFNFSLMSKFNIVLISKSLNEIYALKAAVIIYTTCFNIRISNTNIINFFHMNRRTQSDCDRPVGVCL